MDPNQMQKGLARMRPELDRLESIGIRIRRGIYRAFGLEAVENSEPLVRVVPFITDDGDPVLIWQCPHGNALAATEQPSLN